MAGFNQIKISRRLVLKRLAANISYPLPAGAAVRRVQFYNRTTESVTVRVGSATAGQQVVADVAVGDGALIEATVLTPLINTTAQKLFISADAGFGTAVIDVAIEYDELLDSKGKQPNVDGTDNLPYILHDPV